MVHRVTTNGNGVTTIGSEWQGIDDEWYNEWQRVTTSGTTSDNDWQKVTKNDNDWQRMKASDKTDEYEWK